MVMFWITLSGSNKQPRVFEELSDATQNADALLGVVAIEGFAKHSSDGSSTVPVLMMEVFANGEDED